jgi:hypothetical protein
VKSYIVRIYRCGPEKRSQITGVVEPAECGKGKAFHNLMELWAILAENGELDGTSDTGLDDHSAKKIDFLVQV